MSHNKKRWKPMPQCPLCEQPIRDSQPVEVPEQGPHKDQLCHDGCLKGTWVWTGAGMKDLRST